MKHLLILAALAALTACDTTGPSSTASPTDRRDFAATSAWVPVAGTFPNACSPSEEVVFSGKAHLLAQTQGDKASLFIHWGDVKGVGTVTGDTYVVADNYHERDVFTTTGGTAEWFERLRMVRQGSADNLVGLAHVIFDFGTGTVVLFDVTFKCVG
jgi:hypothetical protein